MKSNNFVEIYLNLEELICLGAITNEQLFLKIDPDWAQLFDLDCFEIIDEIPQHAIECNISNFVCMYTEDFYDIEGSEFLNYKNHQFGNIFRLDKFKTTDYNICFEVPNYYESKYYVSNQVRYQEAIAKALNFGLNKQYTEHHNYITKMISGLPLFMFTKKSFNDALQKQHDFGFKDCFYVTDQSIPQIESFFSKNGLNGHDFRKLLSDLHPSFENINIDVMLTLLVANFTDLYGCFSDYRYGLISKYFYKLNEGWEPNFIHDCNFARLDKLKLKTINPDGSFMFSQKDLNLKRSDVPSVLRLSDCVNQRI